jgi:hypothetical protein
LHLRATKPGQGGPTRVLEHVPSAAAIHAEHRRMGGMFILWNELQALQIEVGEGIFELGMIYHRANLDWGVPILA